MSEILDVFAQMIVLGLLITIIIILLPILVFIAPFVIIFWAIHRVSEL